MSRLADLWTEFRAGKPVRSKSQGIKSIKFLKDDPEYGDCILDDDGCCENFCIEMHWLDADDWELVPEPVKLKRWLNLYKNGDTAMFASQQDAERAAILLPERQGQLVETREIEWSVE